MDRIEAHRLLLEAMNALALEPAPATIAKDVVGAKGTLYRIDIVVEPDDAGALWLNGSIHDRNAFRFELMQERLRIKTT